MSTDNQQKDPIHLITGNEALKAKLQQLATQDFDKFLGMLQVDGLQIFICTERNEKQLSYGQIAIRLQAAGFDITRQSVGDRCKKCQEPPDKKG